MGLSSLLLLAFLSPTQDSATEAALVRAGENRTQLETALQGVSDRERKGLEFLLHHMPKGDLTQLTSEFLVEHVQYAYRAWDAAPWAKSVPERYFLENVLPYASINERRDAWRKDFFERFSPLVQDAKTPSEAAAILNQKVFPMVEVIYSTQRPKADQSPYESIEAGMASCTGLSVLLIDACRAVGVPARFVGTPRWSDDSGNHSWVEIWDDGWHFTGAAEPTGDELNKAWFTDRAAGAKKDSETYGIFAVSFKKTPQRFPMVWRPEADEVYAVNVTERYTQTAQIVPEGSARVRIRVFDGKSGERRAAHVSVKDKQGNPAFEGLSKNERFDANDHLTAILKVGAEYKLNAAFEGQVADLAFVVGPDEQLVEVSLPEAKTLTKEDAERLRVELWKAHAAQIKVDQKAQMEARELIQGDKKMPFAFTTHGEAPKDGHSLWISMHGGGGAPAKVNDRQWENQKKLYQIEEGIYLAPRAPTNTWNLWHEAHIDDLFDRLITNMVAFEGVNPDRVYLLGYSAGGDGVYQLAPRMADRFAAAAMMAGHPNDAKPDGLRNLPFTLHMGAEDGAYDRNKVAAQWKDMLAALHKEDPGGYTHWAKLHEGKGHWMDREDAAALPWMYEHTRNLRPTRIVWRQSSRTHDRFYWLHVAEPKANTRLVVELKGQTVQILENEGIENLTIRLDDSMLDLNQSVTVIQGDKTLFEGKLPRTQAVLEKTLSERGDPRGMWPAELSVSLLP